jgi:UDP-sugar transporter A1/2/3
MTYRKGFATSLSIIISFLASVALFSYPITLAFVIGSSIVLLATYLYNAPSPSSSSSSQSTRTYVAVQPGSPISTSAPILGEPERPSRASSVINLLGLGSGSGSGASSRKTSLTDLRGGMGGGGLGFTPVHYGAAGMRLDMGQSNQGVGGFYSASAPGSPYLASGYSNGHSTTGSGASSPAFGEPPRRASPRPSLGTDVGEKNRRD